MSSVSRCGPLLAGPGSGLRPVLLPQPVAHPALAQQADGPGDGLTHGVPGTRPLQRSQETPPAQQTRAHGRLLGRPLFSRRRTLGLKRPVASDTRGSPDRRRALREVPGTSAALRGGSAGERAFKTSVFYEDPLQSLALPVILFFFLQIYLLPAWTIAHQESL